MRRMAYRLAIALTAVLGSAEAGSAATIVGYQPAACGPSAGCDNWYYLPSTGHWYTLVDYTQPAPWLFGKVRAESSRDSYVPVYDDGTVGTVGTDDIGGQQGYLMTITDPAELELVMAVGEAGWLGGNDAIVEGEWRWVTGPETSLGRGGLLFYDNGAPLPIFPDPTLRLDDVDVGDDYLTLYDGVLQSVPQLSQTQPIQRYWVEFGGAFGAVRLTDNAAVPGAFGIPEVDLPGAQVPLPATLPMLAAALGVCAALARRRRQGASPDHHLHAEGVI